MREGHLLASARLIGCAAILLIAARCDRLTPFVPELELGQMTPLEFGYLGKRTGLGSEYERKIRLEMTPTLSFDERGVGVVFQVRNVGGDALVIVGNEDLILVDRNGRTIGTGEGRMELDPGDATVEQLMGFDWKEISDDRLRGASLVIQVIDARQRRQRPVCRMSLNEVLRVPKAIAGVGAQIGQLRPFE